MSHMIDCETIESTRVDSSKNLTSTWQDVSTLSSNAHINDVVVGRILIKNTSNAGNATVNVALTHTDNTLWEYQEAVIPADGALTMIVWQKCPYDGGVKLRARVTSGTASTQYCGMLKIRQLSK